MTIDTSNPDETPWGEMDRATKAEILMQWNEGAQVQSLHWNYGWCDVGRSYVSWRSKAAYRIKPKEERKTVTLEECIRMTGDLGVTCDIIVKTINGEIDKTAQPRWAK